MRPQATSTAEALRRALAKTPVGEPFASRRLLPGCQSSTVQRELSRLARAGVVQRVAQGVFVRPESSPYVKGPVPPELSKVVRAIAERTGETIQVSGAEAAARLGLSTQLPMRPVFQTTGPSRQVKVGSQVVRLKKASARKLALAGRPAGMALAALWYLGKKEVTRATFEQIQRKLGPAEFKALIAARGQMPAWMVKALEQHQGGRGAGG